MLLSDSRATVAQTSGGGEIRTLESLSTLPPFQDGALDRYATPPCGSYTTNRTTSPRSQAAPSRAPQRVDALQTYDS